MRLTNEAPQHFLIFTFKYFDGHFTVKMWVVPLVDISHAPSTDQAVQLIATEYFPLQSWHTLSPSTSAKQPLPSISGYIIYKTVHMFFCYVNQCSCTINRTPGPNTLQRRDHLALSS